MLQKQKLLRFFLRQLLKREDRNSCTWLNILDAKKKHLTWSTFSSLSTGTFFTNDIPLSLSCDSILLQNK